MPTFAETARRHWWQLAILIALPIIGYWPCIKGEFVFDDDLLVTNCDLVKLPDGLYRIWFTTEPVDYYPVTNSSFWLDWHLWGMNPRGYHVTNLILHIAAVILLWLILQRLSIPGAFLAAAIFAVHPVNVESVAWIAQRKNVLAMLFCLLSTWWYLKADSAPLRVAAKQSSITPFSGHSSTHSSLNPELRTLSTSSYYWLSAIAFLLAMLSKGSVAVLPLLLLWITWWQRTLAKKDFLKAVPFLLIAVVFTAVNIWSQSRFHEVIRTASFVQRLLGAGAMVWFYLYKALLPIHLAFVYPQWNIRADALLWWLPLAACLLVTAFLWSRRHIPWIRAVLAAWGFFCIALLPVMGFTDVGYMQYSLVADHYQHLALIAVAALVGACLTTWQQTLRGLLHVRSANALFGISAATVACLLYLTYWQSSLYANATTLWDDTIKKTRMAGSPMRIWPPSNTRLASRTNRSGTYSGPSI